MNELKKTKGRNETIIKGLLQAGRGEHSCPSQYTWLPNPLCISCWYRCPLIEKDQNQPLANIGRKKNVLKGFGTSQRIQSTAKQPRFSKGKDQSSSGNSDSRKEERCQYFCVTWLNPPTLGRKRMTMTSLSWVLCHPKTGMDRAPWAA